MSFKDFSIFSWLPFCSAEWNRFDNFGRGPYEEHLCQIILNLGLWFMRRCLKKRFMDDA